MRPTLVSPVVLALLAACGSSTPPASTASATTAAPSHEEEPIVVAVRRAAIDRVAIADVESVVGERAILITTRDPDRDTFHMVDLAHDALASDCPDAGDVASVAGAAYWGRGSDDANGNPRVVGLRWLASGEVEPFCAVVLPP